MINLGKMIISYVFCNVFNMPYPRLKKLAGKNCKSAVLFMQILLLGYGIKFI